MRLCDHGCGREAKYHFKTGARSWCCESNVAKCPAIRARNSEKAKQRPHPPHNEETKEKIKQANLGKTASEETKAKMKGPKSEEHKKNLSIAGMGRIPWNKGKTGVYSEEILNKMENGGSWFKKGQIPWNRGIPRTEETKAKLKVSHTGKTLSLGHRQAIGHGNEGGKRTSETRLKMKLAATGDLSSQWKGGIAKEPYSQGWTKELKEQIKKRDGHQCQNPGCGGKCKRLTAHHIDYIKKNCEPGNLITLCVSCNFRANANRELWTEFYQNIMSTKYGYNYDQQIAL